MHRASAAAAACALLLQGKGGREAREREDRLLPCRSANMGKNLRLNPAYLFIARFSWISLVCNGVSHLLPLTAVEISGISRDSMHKRRATGGKQKAWRKKRKYELGRQPANTKLSSNKTVRRVRVRGGNAKWRALRLDTGNYSWGSEAVTRKTRILDVVYNASNNELVRTQTLVKSAIVQVDAAPFKQWYLQHYGIDIGRKKKNPAAKKEATEGQEGEGATEEVKKSNHVGRKLEKRQQGRKLDSHIEEQFGGGRLLACISSRPGQCGRADGYILEGRELDFYVKKIQRKKGKGGSGAA
ncbi:40S ribosomal protein [Asimina triloba]